MAQQGVAAAARAYSQGQSAELQGNYRQAAEFYDLADQIAATPEALRAAARTYQRAGELPIAAMRAEEMRDRYPDDQASLSLANEILEEARQALHRLDVRCVTECMLSSDGVALVPEPDRTHVVYLTAGNHVIEADFGGGYLSVEHVLVAEPGEQSEVTLEGREPEPEPEPIGLGASADLEGDLRDAEASLSTDEVQEDSGGLSPVWFIASGVVTLGLAGAATWSGLDVLDSHEQYESMPTIPAYEDGVDRERRTNILIGAAGGLAALTLLLAVFTDWSGTDEEQDPNEPEIFVGAQPGGASVALVSRLP